MPSTHAYISSRFAPWNCTSWLPSKNLRICSRLNCSISCMRISNPQHAPPLHLQAHLVLESPFPSGSSCIGQDWLAKIHPSNAILSKAAYCVVVFHPPDG